MSTYRLADKNAQWFQGVFPGSDMNLTAKTAACCLHTTESTDWPSYDGGAVAPTYTAKPDLRRCTLNFRAHFPDEKSSRALKNLPGGVETNTLNVVQVELVGTCDPAHAKTWNGKRAGVDYIYWPAAPEWAYVALAEFLVDQHRRHGLQLRAPKTWLPYPASFGASRARMSPAQWRSFAGVCGHQHVPENVHGDPGAFPIDKVLHYAGVILKPPPVPITPLLRRRRWLKARAARGFVRPRPLGAIVVNCMSSTPGVTEERSLAILQRAADHPGVDEIYADELGNVTTDTPLDPAVWDYVHDPSDAARAGSLYAVKISRGKVPACRWLRGSPAGFGIRARFLVKARTIYDPGTTGAWAASNLALHGPPKRAFPLTPTFMRSVRRAGADKAGGDWNRLSRFIAKALPGTTARFVGILGHVSAAWIPVGEPTAVDVGGDHEAVFVTYWPHP